MRLSSELQTKRIVSPADWNEYGEFRDEIRRAAREHFSNCINIFAHSCHLAVFLVKIITIHTSSHFRYMNFHRSTSVTLIVCGTASKTVAYDEEPNWNSKHDQLLFFFCSERSMKQRRINEWKILRLRQARQRQFKTYKNIELNFQFQIVVA